MAAGQCCRAMQCHFGNFATPENYLHFLLASRPKAKHTSRVLFCSTIRNLLQAQFFFSILISPSDDAAALRKSFKLKPSF